LRIKSSINLETFGLIWLDINTNAHPESESYNVEQQLRKIINHFKRFQDTNECQQYIEQTSQTDRLILIINGQLDSNFVSCIHHLSQISSIYICSTDENSRRQWTNQFYKVGKIIT